MPKNNINGYNLTRSWYNFKFENIDKVRHIHSDLYLYVVDLWNRLGQKDNFGLPTTNTMELMGIGSYNTYKKALNDLIEWKFIILVKDSKNQHQSKIVALSNNDKATDKATNKALDKATTKATDTIDKQRNKGTKEQSNTIFYEDVDSCYYECLKHFPTHLQPKDQKQINNWKNTLRLLKDVDKIPLEVVPELVRKVRSDSFWSSNFLSLAKLRKKNKDGHKWIVVFNEKFNKNSNGKTIEQEQDELSRIEELIKDNPMFRV